MDYKTNIASIKKNCALKLSIEMYTVCLKITIIFNISEFVLELIFPQ